jgi:hypothetical protein
LPSLAPPIYPSSPDGPGGSYNLFAGRDASRAYAKSSLEKEDVERRDVADLSPHERDTMYEWYSLFQAKYPVVGKLVEVGGRSGEGGGGGDGAGGAMEESGSSGSSGSSGGGVSGGGVVGGGHFQHEFNNTMSVFSSLGGNGVAQLN